MTNPKKLRKWAVLLLFCAPGAEASGFRLGLSLGFGGAGITRTAVPASSGVAAVAAVSRSEGPGTYSLFVDYLISDFWSIAAEQSKGFRLGPFSSGMTFTGLAGRWYFRGAAPSIGETSEERSTLFIKKFSPFVGPAVGIATGTITRPGDSVTDISSSGVYFGYKFGADYPLAKSIGIRPELDYSTTLTGTDQASEFSVQCGIYFFL